MQVHRTVIDGVLLFVPAPEASITLDAAVARRYGIDPARFVREPRPGPVARGAASGLSGSGGPMLVWCGHGAVYDVVVDARPESRTFGGVATFLLDEDERRRLFVPAGCLHGFQALSTTAEVRCRVDPAPGSALDVAVRVDDPDLALRWPLPVTTAARDGSATRWADLCGRLGAEVPERSCAVGW